MTIFQDAFNFLANNTGNVFRIQYFTESIGSVWDDDRIIAKSGNDLWVSGVLINIDSTEGSADENLLEQGRIKYEDSKFIVGGSVDTTSGTRIFTIMPSGTNRVFREILPGMSLPNWRGAPTMKTIYVRELQGGSLF